MDKRRRTDITSKEEGQITQWTKEKGQITQWTKEGQISHQKKKDR
jgi:hypothetical protein